MKFTVEVSEAELREILKITREKRKGAAIRQLALEALMMKNDKSCWMKSKPESGALTSLPSRICGWTAISGDGR